MIQMEKDRQDGNHVPGYFGTTERHAKHQRFSFVAQGAEKERRPERVGGGLLRSVEGRNSWGKRI